MLFLESIYGSDKMLKIIGASGTEDRPINVASLRKWQYNEMLTGTPRIEENAADHIQGRVPKTVGARHYADLDKIASEDYAMIVPKLLKVLPIHDWMTEKDFEEPEEKKKSSGRSQLSDEKREEIKKLSKDGNSQRDICKITGCARQTVSNALKGIEV